jgi:hypothetical protein
MSKASRHSLYGGEVCDGLYDTENLRWIFFFFFNFLIIKNFIQDLIKLTQIHLGYYYLNIFFIFEKNESPCNAAGKKL